MASRNDPRPSRSNFGVTALLALGMIVFGSATPVSKLVGAAMPVFIAGFLRVCLGAGLLAMAAWPKRAELKTLSRSDWAGVAAIAIFGMFGFSTLMLYGMRAAPGPVGATVMSMTPALTAVAAVLFLKERPTWRKVTAAVLALAGALVLQLGHGLQSGRGGANVTLGAALVFGAVCCESAYTLLGSASRSLSILSS